MISLAHNPNVQDILDRWRLELPIIAQLDESQLTKEHLRLLICILIKTIEADNQPSTINDHPSDSQPQPLSQPDLI